MRAAVRYDSHLMAESRVEASGVQNLEHSAGTFVPVVLRAAAEFTDARSEKANASFRLAKLVASGKIGKLYRLTAAPLPYSQ